MSSSLCDKRGVTLIESVIAILLVSIGLIGLMSMQPSAWQASARADYLGHAAIILSRELTRQELWIMNPCNTVTVSLTPVTQVVNASGQGTAQSGDTSFTVQTTTASSGNGWLVTVRVSWPLNLTGIRESIVVTRQESFRFPPGCV